MERSRAASSLHELILAAVERAAEAHETSRALIEQEHDLARELGETVNAIDRRRRPPGDDVRKRTP